MGIEKNRKNPIAPREATRMLGFPDRVDGVVVARAAGVSKQAIAQWKDCPRNADGTYALPSVLLWLEMRGEARGRAARAAEDDGEVRASQRKRELECLRLEIALAERQGLLVLASDVAGRWGRVFALLRQRVEGVAARVAPRLVGLETREVAAALTDEMTAVLDDFRAAYEREHDADVEERRRAQAESSN